MTFKNFIGSQVLSIHTHSYVIIKFNYLDFHLLSINKIKYMINYKEIT
jgi:hypothetical protein